MNSTSLPVDYLPILIQFIVAGGFVVVVMLATHLLGPKRKSKLKLETFECGIPLHGNARSTILRKIFSCCNPVCAVRCGSNIYVSVGS